MTTTRKTLKTASGATPAVEDGVTVMHDAITWLDIHTDGTEMRRTGRIWEHAPALAGAGKAWWVLPDEYVDGDHTAVLVIRAGRRHRVGRPVKHPKDEARTVWRRDGGRYVDKGEHYRETDPRSRVAHVESGGAAERSWAFAGLVKVDSVDIDRYEAWLRAVEAHYDRAATAATTKGA